MMKRHAQQKSRSEVGVAYLELAIILAILTPLMVTFAFAWLPNFSKRSNELMNALSSLGACLVDPINLYDFKAGQLVLKDDFQPIVQGVVQNCGQMAEGATACGFVYDNQGDNIFTFGLNETPDRLCSTINVKQCVGKDQIPPGLVLAFLLENGEAECEYNPADDPAGENQRGDEAGSGNGGGNNSSMCMTGYFEAACIAQVGGTGDLTCCVNGTTYNPYTKSCDGCPPGTHECVVISSISGCDISLPDCVVYERHRCVSDTDPLYAGGACCHSSHYRPGLFCSDNEQDCGDSTTAMCCPQGQTCASYSAGGWSGCRSASGMCGCAKNSTDSYTLPGECNYMVKTPVPGDSCGSSGSAGSGDLFPPPPGSC